MTREFKNSPEVRAELAARARKYRAENPKYDKKYKKKYRKTNASHIKKYGVQYRKDHAEDLKKKAHQYYLDNKETLHKKCQDWRAKNPKKARAASRRHYLKYRDKYLGKPYDKKKRRQAYLGYRDALLARQRAFRALAKGKRLLRPHLEVFFHGFDITF